MLVVVVSVVALLALTWGTYYDWPDFVHLDYGFPLTWGTLTLSTIAGPPAAPWRVDVVALQADLAFWLGLIIIVVILGRKFKN